MALRLYNTMGHKLEEFKPINDGFCGFYGCGPTVYNYAHIGNLRAYVFLDTLDRTLRYLGYSIKHVMNITDIGHLSGDADDGDDKMLKTAKERGQSVLEIADFYTKAFYNDIDRLNIRRPDVVCKATEHVQEMIDLIKRIEANGHTYMAGGNLYYDVTTYPDYGKLANLNLDELKAGAGKRDVVVVDENKRNPYDFVLWFTKSKFEDQALTWDSPWGRGYPGWHIECSAMSMKYLGEHFDIHTGGIDHIPIHHTNEIAQSEGATGKKWVNYWLHNEFLVIAKPKKADGTADENAEAGKMSKSSGNFLTLQTLIDKGYDALDYRFFLLGGHYRSQIAFSWDAMDSAKNSRKALVKRVAALLADCGYSEGKKPEQVIGLAEELAGNGWSEAAKAHLDRFQAAIEDDLSTPKALSELQVTIKDAAVAAEEKLRIVAAMDFVLGFNLIETAVAFNRDAATAPAAGGTGDSEIDALVAERNEAKKNKNWARADEIRNILKEKGITLIDTPQGTTWKKE